jgi:hypothetical protein
MTAASEAGNGEDNAVKTTAGFKLEGRTLHRGSATSFEVHSVLHDGDLHRARSNARHPEN